MRKRYRIVLVVLLVAAVGGLGWRVSRQREPVYEGQPLSVWLEEYSTNRFAFPASEHSKRMKAEAETAIRGIGTNALPVMLEMLAAKDSSVKEKVIALARKLPFLSIHLHAAHNYHVMGGGGLQILGPVATPAVPALINLLNDNDKDIRLNSCFCLYAIGVDAQDAVPALVRHVKDIDYMVQEESVNVLGRIHLRPSLVVPVLVQRLRDVPVRPSARRGMIAGTIIALGKFGDQAKEAAPAIELFLSDTEKDIRSSATNALKKIDPEAAAKAGVK